MSRSIERAIDALVASQQPITVRNVMAAYIQVANFSNGDVYLEDAIIAFEHALDKHPRPYEFEGCQAACYNRPYIQEVDKLRRDYWVERRGSAPCTCRRCGGPITEESSVGAVDNSINAQYGIREGGRKTGQKRKLRRKRLAVEQASDPYGPSTSAAVL